MSSLTQPEAPAGDVLLAARNLRKVFAADRTPVLEDVTVELRTGEFVALLGPSGSGKSTLLRILAGLVPPSQGEVVLDGVPLEGVNPRVAIVFQSFALFPWLTVQQNVELGLLPLRLREDERRTRALKAIDLIGLDGFEEAFPKELSGGMRQRVGFARALVVQPDILFLDEPFSALDVLTAENLRTDLQELWTERAMPTRAILMVTHNVDEAVSLADRILIFGTNPGRIRVELEGIAIAERRRKNLRRAQLVDTIYRVMTNPDLDAAAIVAEQRARGVVARPHAGGVRRRRYQALPDVSTDDVIGLVQYLSGIGGHIELRVLERDLQMGADDLFPLIEAADLLGLADLGEREVIVTPLGHRFADAALDEQKTIFRRTAVNQLSLIRFIVRQLETSPSHTADAEEILDELRHSFTGDEAQRQLDTAVEWGRYAEAFTYDDTTGQLRLDEEHRGPPDPELQIEPD
jgi:NitT/TauT family transport system ATP-binding protein